MPLIKAREEAYVVMKEIMYKLSLSPSLWRLSHVSLPVYPRNQSIEATILEKRLMYQKP